MPREGQTSANDEQKSVIKVVLDVSLKCQTLLQVLHNVKIFKHLNNSYDVL